MIQGIAGITGIQPAVKAAAADNTQSELAQQFGNFLNTAIDNLNKQQNEVSQLNNKAVISGDLADVQKLMIATEKSTISLQLTAQIRNKVIDAYQEIMRMQI